MSKLGKTLSHLKPATPRQLNCFNKLLDKHCLLFVCASLWLDPRSDHDIDIIIDVSRYQMSPLTGPDEETSVLTSRATSGSFTETERQLRGGKRAYWKLQSSVTLQ